MSEQKMRPCTNCHGPIRCELCGTLQVEQESEGVVVRAIELPDCRPILFIPDKLLGDDHYLVTRIEANDSSL